MSIMTEIDYVETQKTLDSWNAQYVEALFRFNQKPRATLEERKALQEIDGRKETVDEYRLRILNELFHKISNPPWETPHVKPVTSAHERAVKLAEARKQQRKIEIRKENAEIREGLEARIAQARKWQEEDGEDHSGFIESLEAAIALTYKIKR